MAKDTLEKALLKRIKGSDPRALRAALTFTGGKPTIVLGVVGDHPRVTIEIDGDKVSVAGDAPAPAQGGDVNGAGGVVGETPPGETSPPHAAAKGGSQDETGGDGQKGGTSKK